MYNENNNDRSYFFRDLIVKILLVLLFVFLLMWLFPMPNLSPFYDRIFTENLNTMTDAAKSYYTSARLPQKEGETKTLTLKEMLDNKMILEFTDSDGKTCDANKSYVEVTKKDGEWLYKTFLSCGEQEDFVIEHSGCTDLCADGKCTEEETKEVTEYQFYKVTDVKLIDKYLCSEGYTLEGTKCILKTNTEEKEDAQLNCATGYTYNDDLNLCEKTETENFNAYKKCPSGYVYATSMNKCIKVETSTTNANLSYECANGTLNGTKCIISGSSEIPSTENLSCTTGTLNGTKCVLETTSTLVYSCTTGTISSDNTKCTTEVPSTVTYSCTTGTLSGTQCAIKTPHQSCDYEWSCSYTLYSTQKGEVDGDYFKRTPAGMVGSLYRYKECTRIEKGCTTTYTTSYVAATPSYSCTTGTLSLDKTKCITEAPSVKTYSCTQGTLSSDKTKCTIETTPNKTYSCSVGTLSSDKTKCIISSTTEIDATRKYSCCVGTLSGDKCIIQIIKETNYTYYCPYGILNGNKCVLTTYDRIDPTYVCKSGYTQVGTSCYKTSTITDTKNATPVYKTVSQKTYKWSRNKTLSGWTFTGKTRTIKVAA